MRYEEHTYTDNSKNPLIKSFFSSVSPGKREYREHHHAECEISTFLSGSGIYTVNGKTYEFSSGDVFLFSGDEIHCITEIFSEFELLNIHFMPSVLWSENDDLSLLKIFFARSTDFENRIDSKNPSTALIHAQIRELARELAEKADGYRIIAKYKLFSIFALLIRDYDYIDESLEYTNYKSTVRPIKTALTYIDENIEKNVTLADIAGVATMSQTYFSTVFKKLNGISPWEYITIKRVEKAIELLKTTDMTKLDIAMQCGFNSSSNFYKAFYNVTGKKPGSFQKKHST